MRLGNFVMLRNGDYCIVANIRGAYYLVALNGQTLDLNEYHGYKNNYIHDLDIIMVWYDISMEGLIYDERNIPQN